MRKILIAACCAGLVGSISVAAAQTTAPPSQGAMKATSPMDSNAKMKKHKHMKKGTMKSDTMKSDSMKKDGMDKGGMSK
jgi:pentapeptide MXKDX repeat protein